MKFKDLFISIILLTALLLWGYRIATLKDNGIYTPDVGDFEAAVEDSQEVDLPRGNHGIFIRGWMYDR